MMVGMTGIALAGAAGSGGAGLAGAGAAGTGAALAGLAGLLADRTRATICLALMDGRAWTASELARAAGVAPSTATEHLNLLVSGGLLTEVRQGRHRYVRLADDAAELVELLAAAAPTEAQATAGPPVRSLTAAHRRRALAAARTCYDHLAGALGVAVTDAMTTRGLLSWDRGLTLTDDGDRWLSALAGAWPRRRAVRWCGPAWTGPSAGRTSPDRPARPSAPMPSMPVGWCGRTDPVRCGSPTSAGSSCAISSGWSCRPPSLSPRQVRRTLSVPAPR